MPKIALTWTASLAVALFVPTAASVAQNFPAKPLRIVTTTVGGSNDILARIVASGIATPLGQQVIVDNRGGGVSPGIAVSRMAADGYALMIHSSTAWTAMLLDKSAPPYDIDRDFAAISLLGRSPSLILTHPSLPVRSVRELVALAKARPGELNMTSGPAGSQSFVASALFKSMAGVNITLVGYSNQSQESADLLGGYIQLAIGSAGSFMPIVKTGRLKALAVTSLTPSLLFPDLPTVAATVPGFEAAGVYGFWAPAKTPEAVIARLNQETVRYLKSPEAADRMLKSGIEPASSSPAELASYIRTDIARVNKVLETAGLNRK